MIRIDRFARFSHNLRTCAGTKNRLRLRRRGRLLAGSRVEAEKRLMMNRQYRQDAGLVLLAIAVRAGAVLILQSHLVPRSTYEHGEIAANLLAGHGFSVRFLGALGPTSQQAPIYPALVALAYAVGGAETPAALLILQLGQTILGGLLVLGVLRLAREVAPDQRAVSVAAGLIAALHPTLVYAATHVQVVSLGATLLTWTLVFAFRTGMSGGSASALVTGALLGAVTLCDPILAMVGVGALWAIVQAVSARGHSRAQASRLGVLVVLTAAAAIAPWTVRNALVHGELVAIKSTFGYAFWQGNCALSEGTDKVVRASVEQVLDEGKSQSGLASLNRRLWAARHEAGYIDDIALTRGDLKMLGSVSEPERSRILFRRAINRAPRPSWQVLAALPASLTLLLAVRRDQPQDASAGLPDQPSDAHIGRPARPGARQKRGSRKVVADDRNGSLDRPFPYVDHRLDAIPHSD